jgi:hypothetical protein
MSDPEDELRVEGEAGAKAGGGGAGTGGEVIGGHLEGNKGGELYYRDTPGNVGPKADVKARRQEPTPPASDLRPAGPGAVQGQANDLSGSSEPLPADAGTPLSATDRGNPPAAGVDAAGNRTGASLRQAQGGDAGSATAGDIPADATDDVLAGEG